MTPIDDAHREAAWGGGMPPRHGAAGGTPTRLRERFGRLDA
jgi:hypothetical protein